MLRPCVSSINAVRSALLQPGFTWFRERARRALWFTGGAIAMLVGLIGLFLPLMPTVPFLLLAVMSLFARLPALRALDARPPAFRPAAARFARTSRCVAGHQAFRDADDDDRRARCVVGAGVALALAPWSGMRRSRVLVVETADARAQPTRRGLGACRAVGRGRRAQADGRRRQAHDSAEQRMVLLMRLMAGQRVPVQ